MRVNEYTAKRVLIDPDCSAIAGCRKRRARIACSRSLPPSSPPAEKATGSQDQAGESSTGDGAGDDRARSSSIADLDARSLGRTRCKVQVVLGIHYTARADRLIPALTGVKWIVRRICECSKGPRYSIKSQCNCNRTARGHA